MERYAIILAAGKGTRMKTHSEDISKVSFPILGKPLVRYVLDALKPLGLSKIVTIVGHGGEHAKKIVEDSSEVVWQHVQKGAGHAVMQAAPVLAGKEGETIICCGDTPMLTPETLGALFEAHEKNGNEMTVLTFITDAPHGYGRIVKDSKGNILKIQEQRDCSPEEELITEVNAGAYVIDNKKLFEYLDKLTPNNAAGEYYLTDILGLFASDGLKVGSFSVSDVEETLGINDRNQLSVGGKILQKRINKKHMLNGITIVDPDNTYIGPDVEIGNDCEILPNTIILGHSKIGECGRIGPNTYLEDCEVGNDVVLDNVKAVGKTIEDGVKAGPFVEIK